MSPFSPRPFVWRKLALGDCLTVGGLIVLIVIGVTLSWGKICRSIQMYDLAEYRTKIAPVQVDDTIKKELLDKLTHLDHQANSKSLGLERWTGHDIKIKAILTDGKIDPVELMILAIEFAQMEQEFTSSRDSYPHN